MNNDKTKKKKFLLIPCKLCVVRYSILFYSILDRLTKAVPLVASIAICLAALIPATFFGDMLTCYFNF